MKNFIKTFLVLFTTGFLFSGNLLAQQLFAGNANDIKVAKESSTDINHDLVTNEAVISPASLAASNAKLSTRFNSQFPQASMQQWIASNQVFYVSFLNNGRKTKACFTPEGRLNYTVTACTLEQLPTSLRKNILASYKTYTLFNAIEIDAYGSIAHQVVLENAKGFITLSSTEEGVTEIQQVTKGATR